MNKKILAPVAALVLCLFTVSAFAEAVPSKTTSDVVAVQSTGSVTVAVAQPTAATTAILEEVAALANSNVSVVEYFGIQDVVAELGDETVAADLKVDELFPIVVSGAPAGDTVVTVSTAAVYTEADKPIVLVSTVVDGKIVWKPVQYTIVNGQLVLTFTEELLLAMEGGAANLTILSTK